MNSKLNTEDIKFMIPDYLSGMLNEADKALVDDAIKNSTELRDFFNEMKDTFSFVNSVQFDEPHPQYWNSLLPRIHERIDTASEKSFSWNKIAAFWKVLLPVAAVILIAVVYYIATPSENQITEEKKTEQIINDTSKKDNITKENTDQDKSVENTDKLANDKNKSETDKTVKKNIIRKENSQKPDNANVHNTLPDNETEKEVQEPVKIDQLTADIDETSLFAEGESAGFDEETENELKKLNDSEKENLLEALENINL